ncbi:MAG: hypothetical protein AAFY56_15775, partial [Pseudomonadota bacterium]
ETATLMTGRDIREHFGVRPMINLTGTLTVNGGISARPEAIEAAAAMLRHGVDMAEFQARASQIIAAATGAEAGFVSACSAAGICMGIAGAMTGDDMAKIEQLPNTQGMKSEVVIQLGHVVNYGHSIGQDIRQTGAKTVAFGDVNAAKLHQLEAAITPQTAAALYVVSHHCVDYGQIPFGTFRDVCAKHGVPVIVDLAAEYDLKSYLTAGADLTIHSSHKFLGGPTAGIVAGKKTLVRTAFLQNYGIARPMKAGKESIAGALAALQSWQVMDHQAERARQREALGYWQRQLNDLPGTEATIDPDPTGNPFDRLKLAIDSNTAGLSALELVYQLETGDPPIMVRAHQLEHGYFIMDPRSLGQGEQEIVTQRLRDIFAKAGQGDGPPNPASVHAWKTTKASALKTWPDIEIA